MQVKPGFSMLQALSTALQPATARTQQGQPGNEPALAVAPLQKDPSGSVAPSLPEAGLNMNAPRGTYLNIRV